MKLDLSKYYKIILLLFAISVVSCSSNKQDDCMKTITIPQFYTLENQTYRYDIEQEVPCDTELITEPVSIVPPKLEGFTYEVISFKYTSDTGNNSTKLEFEIKLNNPKGYSVKGFPYFTIKSDSTEFSTKYTGLLTSSCTTISGNSSCTVTLSREENRDLGFANSFELLNVEYYLTK